ncbi:hypothetical protein VCRA217O17_50004 [Vibrio crassostreae]|nr:hypothetical protein VCRA217O17_50004 [Vibrio crassostreae]
MGRTPTDKSYDNMNLNFVGLLSQGYTAPTLQHSAAQKIPLSSDTSFLCPPVFSLQEATQ